VTDSEVNKNRLKLFVKTLSYGMRPRRAGKFLLARQAFQERYEPAFRAQRKQVTVARE